jgi:chemotaxis family two-component system sensor kinase Cph1
VLRPGFVAPAFGRADLSNCEREQIHYAGSIQPHGALLVVRENDLAIVQASANAGAMLGLGAPLLGRSLADLPGDLLDSISPHFNAPLQTLPVAVRCTVGSRGEAFDAMLHRPPSGGLIVELERAGPTIDLALAIETAMQRIVGAFSLRSLCDEAAAIFKELSGYHRVMVYRFDEDGHGEVFSEAREPGLEPYIGNRYPASDIPQIARRLYLRNRVRLLADVTYAPVPVEPRLSPLTGEDLDMSLCALRSMSPIHAQYLTNMGVSGTLVASLVIGGRLWGLVSCHHYEPRIVPFDMRSVCELLAEAVSTRIAALESFAQGQADLAVRRLEQRLIEAIGRDGNWRAALFDSAQSLLLPLGATGAALLFEGEVLATGDVPGTQALRQIGAWLSERMTGPLFSTASLALDRPEFAAEAAVASGVAAVRISQTRDDFLIWLRPERVRTVTWGGDPFKPVLIGDDPATLSPRRSFAKWHQLVEGTSDPWTPTDLMAARLIGATLSDVVLQFRTVQMLIAQTQLAKVRDQVQAAEQATIVADATGRILLANDVFARLLRVPEPGPQHIDELPELFAEPGDVRLRLRELMRSQRIWRGEVRVRTALEVGAPLMVRADPVLSSPDKVLGFVLLFTDASEKKLAESARERFQDGIIAGHRVLARRMESTDDLVFQNLLASLVENAQLAALEITDGLETADMAEMLEGVRVSINRSAEILEHLMWYAGERPKGRR